MGLFARDAACDRCAATTPKNELNGFDPSWRHERKSDDQRRKLCSACLPEALGEYLRSYNFRALAIEPTAERGGYSFAPLDIRTRSFLWTEDLKDRIRDLLPAPDAVCSHCGGAAQFNWCDLDIFEGSPFELELRWRGRFREEALCGGCAARAFAEAYQRAGAILQEVLPPADGDGFIGPGEY